MKLFLVRYGTVCTMQIFITVTVFRLYNEHNLYSAMMKLRFDCQDETNIIGKQLFVKSNFKYWNPKLEQVENSYQNNKNTS